MTPDTHNTHHLRACLEAGIAAAAATPRLDGLATQAEVARIGARLAADLRRLVGMLADDERVAARRAA